MEPLIAWANSIGLEDVAEVFEKTLQEEKEADEKLTQVAEEILSALRASQRSEETETAEQLAGARRKRTVNSTPHSTHSIAHSANAGLSARSR